MSARVQGSVAATFRHQTVVAAVHRACRQCQAPGVYLSEARILDGWEGCWVSPHDDRLGMSVGPVCPHCGAVRSDAEARGVVWEKWVFGSRLQMLSWRLRRVFALCRKGH